MSHHGHSSNDRKGRAAKPMRRKDREAWRVPASPSHRRPDLGPGARLLPHSSGRPAAHRGATAHARLQRNCRAPAQLETFSRVCVRVHVRVRQRQARWSIRGRTQRNKGMTGARAAERMNRSLAGRSCLRLHGMDRHRVGPRRDPAGRGRQRCEGPRWRPCGAGHLKAFPALRNDKVKHLLGAAQVQLRTGAPGNSEPVCFSRNADESAAGFCLPPRVINTWRPCRWGRRLRHCGRLSVSRPCPSSR